ncbi:hypothetical protein B0H10DRAFT_2440502 [Mycena sp. CBHHK59/15]|nr:hypothetical protein B0H10DRAFT_2440502 [Mycena sp. CBHHK59/15]
MKFGLPFLLGPLLCARADTTPAQYDPDSQSCPGSCLGTYTNAQFASGNCFGTIGFCVCSGTLDSPPLGNLTACLTGAACSMSLADTQTYITGLVAFEGCSSSALSSAYDSSSSTLSNGGLATDRTTSLAGPKASDAKSTGGGVRWQYTTEFRGLVALSAAFSGMLAGMLLV